jgi:cellobiose-specific phosphotransferase system component IIC
LQTLSFDFKFKVSKGEKFQMNDKFMNGLLTVAGKMQSNKVLSAIKDGFIDNMPIIIMGSFCTLFQWVITTTNPRLRFLS